MQDHLHQHTTVGTGSFFGNLFQTYVPRQQCMYHETGLIALHGFSDFLITFAYFSIPLALIYFARRRPDLSFNGMFLLFAAFIILCGITHFFGILSIWRTYYRLDGLFKLATGLVSVATALILWRLMPVAIALPSREELMRRRDELEGLVAKRTEELSKANKALQESEEKYKQAAQKAETANEAKTAFLSNMSHELRTPLGVVVGIADILARKKDLSDSDYELVSTLQIGASTLETLINDLLDIGQIETSRIKLNAVPFHINDIVAEAGSFYTRKAEDKGLVFEFQGAPQDQLFIGDPARISQIIGNLVSNAIKYTEEGKITLTASITPHEYPDYRNIALTVTDTGSGIRGEMLEKIFDRFIRANENSASGSGLGLAISKGLAEVMGGRITVKSRPGEGSEFTLYLTLPLAEERAPTSETLETGPAEEEIEAGGSGIILVADDHPANQLVARNMLADMGYSTITVENGEKALEKIEELRDELCGVLMDVRMPVMDGIEATRQLRETEKAQGLDHLPVIAVTAHALKGDKELCLEAGMDDYLSKPFRRERLKTIINKLVAERKEC